MGEVFGRRSDALTAHPHRCQRINRKGMCREDCRATWRQKDLSNQFKNVVRTITQNNLVSFHASMLGQCFFQLKIIGVACKTIDRCLHCNLCLWAHAQRVFVGCQLDNRLDRQLEFTSHFGDRLTGLVGSDLFDIA